MGTGWMDVRHWYEDPPDEQDFIDAEKARARNTHRFHACDLPDCFPCGGGLALCELCGGAEGTLPYECPGAKITEEQGQAVMNQTLDFIAGEWRVPTPQKKSDNSQEGKRTE